MFDAWVGEDPLEKGMATHSSILAWRIPWTEEPGGLQSMGLLLLLLLLLSHFSRVQLMSAGGPPVPGILLARTLEWVAISFSNAGK